MENLRKKTHDHLLERRGVARSLVTFVWPIELVVVLVWAVMGNVRVP